MLSYNLTFKTTSNIDEVSNIDFWKGQPYEAFIIKNSKNLTLYKVVPEIKTSLYVM